MAAGNLPSHLYYKRLKHTFRGEALAFGGKMAAEPYTADNPETRLALFDFAFEKAPIGIALVDVEGRIIRGNAAFAKLVGLPIEKVLGTHFRDFTHPDDIEADLILFTCFFRMRRRPGRTPLGFSRHLDPCSDRNLHLSQGCQSSWFREQYALIVLLGGL